MDEQTITTQRDFGLIAEHDVAIKSDRIEYHAPGCSAARRGGAEVIRRAMPALEFAAFRREAEAEAAEVGEAGTVFHRCLGSLPKAEA